MRGGHFPWRSQIAGGGVRLFLFMPENGPQSYKSLPAHLKDVDEKQGIVQAYWSAFGNVDSDGDIIVRGAYSKTIQEWGPSGADRIKFLWQHDSWEPIGKPIEIEETALGLLATTKIEKTRRGMDALVLYEAGVINEHSVGIDILRRSDDDERIIKEVKLYEGSAVTWGANENTPTVSVKSRIKDALKRDLSDEVAATLEKALGDVELSEDEIRRRLYEALKHNTVSFSAPDNAAPPNGTRSDVAPHTKDELRKQLINKLSVCHGRNRQAT